MSIQRFEWGWVEWFEESIDTLNIGISHLNPGACQRPHVHYENEQCIYVLEGNGKHSINKDEKVVTKGNSIYLPFNCIHATCNLSNNPLIELVISSPRRDKNFKIKEFSVNRYAEYKESINAAIDALNLEEESPENIPFFIKDVHNNIVFKSKILRKIEYDAKEKEDDNADNMIIIPLKYDDEELGKLYCDLNILKETASTNISESSINSIKLFLKDLSSSLNSFCKFNNIQKKLIKHKNILNVKGPDENINIGDKNKSNSNNLKINFHFLFNTLNYMASLAFEQENEELYKSIIVLSRLFRYISDNSGKMISIKEEIGYLENYIYLQKIRYKENLEVIYDIDEEILNSEIPINCLQPIIENAFSHGFMKYDGKKIIEISIIRSEKERIKIIIKNNGRVMDMSSIKKIKESLGNFENHGLMLVYEKLKLNYGDDFDLDIYVENTKTVFEINIPYKEKSC